MVSPVILGTVVNCTTKIPATTMAIVEDRISVVPNLAMTEKVHNTVATAVCPVTKRKARTTIVALNPVT
jgi:hypothetical protein